MDESVPFDFNLVLTLEIQPKSLRGSEIAGQTQRGVGASPPLFVHDFVDPTAGSANSDGQLVLGDPQRLEVLGEEDLPGAN